MRTVNMHEAKTHLSKLVETSVASGEAFIIARAGKAMVKVVPVNAPEAAKSRLGFLKGAIQFPPDFDEMGGDEIAALFGADG